MKLFIFILSTSLLAGFTLEKRISVDADQIHTDQLNNVYLVKEKKVRKISLDGTFDYEFNSRRYGDITSIDVTRPLKPMLFYRDLSQLIVLDNTMSMQGGPIDLFERNLGQVTAAAVSVNDHFWLYNLENFELLRVTSSFKTVNKSGNLTQVMGAGVMPNFMVEVDNWLYVNDPSLGILVFDIYGTYSKKIPLKGLSFFQVIGGKIYFQKDRKLFAYDTKSHTSEPIELPVEDFDDIRVSSNKLFVLKDNWLEVYKSMK